MATSRTVQTLNLAYGIDHQTPAHAATLAVTVSDSYTILEPAIATANVTLNLTVASEMPKGARLVIKFKTTATETLTAGTGCKFATVTGVAGKTQVFECVFDGTNFIGIGAKQQID